jgi:hypothetical protein
LQAFHITYYNSILDSELGQKKTLKRKAPVKPAVDNSDGSSEDWKTDDSDWEKYENQSSKKRKKKGLYMCHLYCVTKMDLKMLRRC